MEKLLEIKNLKVIYKTERATGQALNGMSISLNPGESLGLVGEAGAGKTTTALSILNLLPRAGHILEGEILFHGKNVLKMSKKELQHMRGHQISMIFQNPLTSLNPVFTVGEQISMVLRHHLNMKPKQAEERAKELLEAVGIPAYRLHDYPVQFSGGMRQIVGIARALSLNPRFIICDEPVSALDVSVQAKIINLLKDLQKERNLSYLFISHDLSVVRHISDRVAVMYLGQIIEMADKETIFKDTRHPYSLALLSAVPKVSIGQKVHRIVLKGDVPSPMNPKPGCRFAPRCWMARPECMNQNQTLQEVSPGHFVACQYAHISREQMKDAATATLKNLTANE